MLNRIETSKGLIGDTTWLKCAYPKLWGRVRFSLCVLETLLDVALDSMVREDQFLEDGRFVFWASTRHLAAQTKHASLGSLAPSTTSNRLALLTFLGLIEKLPDSQIPDALLHHAQRHKLRRGLPRRINFFSIPDLTSEVLVAAERRAADFAAKGMTMNGMSVEMIAGGDGNITASRVFPQERLTPRLTDLKSSVLAAAHGLLSRCGYVRKSDLFTILSATREGEKTAVNRVFPAVVVELGLMKCHATKAIKDCLHIESQGFPIIYVPNKPMSVSARSKVICHDCHRGEEPSDSNHRLQTSSQLVGLPPMQPEL